jgi:DNA-directed RNA polymerase specialized sigma24 family protein
MYGPLGRKPAPFSKEPNSPIIAEGITLGPLPRDPLPTMSSQSDQSREETWRALMAAAQDGDGAAYARLLSELLPVLRRVVRRKWRTSQDAEDIVQEVLMSLHSVRQTYDPRRPFMPWLMTITSRRIADAARRASARYSHETTVDVMPETFVGHDSKTPHDSSDDQAAIRTAMSFL